MINVNNYNADTDSKTIENAIKNRGEDGTILIPPRKSDIEPERDWWLIDRAILIPQNTTVIIQNCKIKLSDKCRDNFFRTANCGLGIEYPEKISGVHIKGEGRCILEGADHPRATGDGGKILACPCPHEPEDLLRYADWVSEESKEAGTLDMGDMHSHSYGTDFGKEGESQYGDWRGIGILFANVDDFSIENITISDSHGWGISLESCAYGRVEKITFDCYMYKDIDGMRHNIENQDGVDIRNGCHDIIISDISGCTGDDLVALTAIADEACIPGGSLNSTHVMHSDWTKRESGIHDIIIRNIKGYSNLCWMVRLLSINTKIRNVIIDGIMDTSTDDIINNGGVLIGEYDGPYGKNLPGSISHVSISNVISNGGAAVEVLGYLKDSVISNVINKRGKERRSFVVVREDALDNVSVCNVLGGVRM